MSVRPREISLMHTKREQPFGSWKSPITAQMIVSETTGLGEPVAAARNMGIIAMKVFADGAMYTKDPKWSRTPADVVLAVGSSEIPSRPLVEYSLSTPGISTAIIGTGRVDNEDKNCQLIQNLAAAQIRAGGLSQSDREETERRAARIKDGKTNWFQLSSQPLGSPRKPAVVLEKRGDNRIARLTWQTAYAGDMPITHYEIWRDQEKVGEVQHKPQATKSPFSFEDKPADQASHAYSIVTVDAAGRKARTEELRVAYRF